MGVAAGKGSGYRGGGAAGHIPSLPISRHSLKAKRADKRRGQGKAMAETPQPFYLPIKSPITAGKNETETLSAGKCQGGGARLSVSALLNGQAKTKRLPHHSDISQGEF